MALQYTVTVTDWTQPRGYRGSGRGWRVSCFALANDDWNSVGRRVSETFHRSEGAARKYAAELARQYGAELL